MNEPKPASPLALDFPMRPDFLAQVVIPRDFTHKEAQRLAAFVMSIPPPTTKAGDKP